MGQTILGSCQFQPPLLNFLTPSIHHKPSFTPRSGSHLVFALPTPLRPRRDFSCSISNPADFQDAKISNNLPLSLRYTTVDPPRLPSENPIGDLLENTLSSGSRLRNRRRGRPSSLSLVQEAYAKQGDIAGGMVMPPDYGSPETTVSASLMVANSIHNLQTQPRATRNIHSHPCLGRAIDIKQRTDLARSFFLLNRLVRTNRIKLDQRMQRFHERPGVRRKRLQRERWRARFKDNFRNAVEKIRTMKRMGW